MPQIFSRGDHVYQCDTCNRRVRVPANDRGLDIVQRCIITNDCPGKLHKVLLRKDINSTPASTPKVVGVEDWTQRRVLFNYEQSIEDTEWIINHDLGSIPTLQVFINKDTSDGEISVETLDYILTVTDLNTISITFENAQSGIAQCIAHASVNTTNPQQVAPSTPISNVSISNSGILTIATLETTPPTALVDIAVEFKNPVDNTMTRYVFNDVDAIPDAESPWAGAHQVMVAGQMFDVRTFDITTEGPIVSGSQMTIYFGDDITIDVDTGAFIGAVRTTDYKQNLILLGKPPYSVPDRITNSYIDMAAISTIQPELYYAGGEVWCATSKIRQVYPPIMVVE